MQPADEFFELRRQSQANVAVFLKAEIDLATTMLDIAKTTNDDAHRTRLLESIQGAIDTVRYFEKQIADEHQRLKFQQGADELEAAVRRCESGTLT